MSRALRVGVAGATGALGKEVVAVLDAAPWRPEAVVPFAGPASTVPFVEYGGSQVAVDDLAQADLAGLDLLIVALPRALAPEVIARAVRDGTRVVDLSGSQLEALDVPLVAPWLGLDALGEARARDVVAVPSGPGLLLATVLRPLVDAGWDEELEAQVLVPASTFGRDAVEELSRQVVALFNAAPPPRKQFPHGLAFDLLPLVGELGATGWTSEEVRVVAELGRLLGVRVDVSLVAAPVFSGLSATVRAYVPDDVAVEGVVHALTEAGLEVATHGDLRRLPRPRRVEGSPWPQVARVRRGAGAVHLWASMDNLRAVAAAAVGVAAALLGEVEEA
ncbi:MAG: hypothetical protein H6732_17740 [Alphaproteobacteria bacterium]|nr:hypothetical protein [Alphaproteobacteria bacterium]